MQQPSQPSPSHTQGLADSAIDAAWAMLSPDLELENARLLPIVVGAHPRSEVADRPLANRLAVAIRQWQRAHVERESARLIPLVMSDLWYLNDQELLLQPTITIGEPSHNAASAYYGTRLPKAYVVDGKLQVLADLAFLEPSVTMWGVDAHATRTALDWFIARQMPAFLESIHS
ncbi:MAG: hypothetical protein DWH97_07135 [Planctomycetota bacterium]|jgi:hypothetical protein|nr:MAG: hypothetical protein DWH97_07135 [Planctomycetota bacterium]RLS94467.1 MAG: hypothetical protein DWI12_06695 [Planctomycetota bacterium]